MYSGMPSLQVECPMCRLPVTYNLTQLQSFASKELKEEEVCCFSLEKCVQEFGCCLRNCARMVVFCIFACINTKGEIKSKEWSSQWIFQFKQSTTAVQIWIISYTSHHFTPHGRYELNKLTSLPMCGFIAQLVEQSRWSPDFFQASSFQLLKLENSLRWSFFTFIYHRSSNMNYFIYFTIIF